MPSKIVKTTQANINKVVASGQSVRVGFTNNASRRAGEYKRSGIQGTMLVAPTTNGRKSENRLLATQFANNKSHKNVQSRSNISNGTEGVVYCFINTK